MSTVSFPGVKSGRGVKLAPHPLLVPWSRKSTAIPLLPLWTVRPVQSLSACTRVHFTFYLFIQYKRITYIFLQYFVSNFVPMLRNYDLSLKDFRHKEGLNDRYVEERTFYQTDNVNGVTVKISGQVASVKTRWKIWRIVKKCWYCTCLCNVCHQSR